MKNFHLNHYEKAFGNWLVDNHVNYIAVDEQKRAALGHSKIKSFDYILNLPGQQTMIAEVKGRAFKGTSFAKMTGFECWVGTEDVDGLTQWQEVFGPGHTAAFIFAYRIEKVDVDFDGREIYDFNGDKYAFFCIKLDDYRKFMKVRSSGWQTVTLSAEKFRQCVVQMQSVMV